MFWPFRKTSGWQQVKGSEGFVIDMPAPPQRQRQTLDTTNWQLTLSIYLAKAEGGLTCQVTVRSGPAVATRGDAELVEAWKTEFLTSMAAAGVHMRVGIVVRANSRPERADTTKSWPSHPVFVWRTLLPLPADEDECAYDEQDAQYLGCPHSADFMHPSQDWRDPHVGTVR